MASTSGCVAPPSRPSCPVPFYQNSSIEYRIDKTSLPRVLCLGDSIGGPSCRAAARHPLIADKVELRPILFKRANDSVLLNSFGAGNLAKCVSTWLQGTCKPGEVHPPCPAPRMRWKGVVMGAGAWDLRSLPACEMNEARMQRQIGQVRNAVKAALNHADVVVWMTTTPAAEHAGCCRDRHYNYSAAEHLHGSITSIGYCHHDAIRQNDRVREMLRASFSSQRVAIADTYAAVASRCGAHYRDCSIQPQRSADGRRYVCKVHFEKSSFAEVHGPAVARALSGLLGS